MDIKVQAVNFSADEGLVEFTEERLSKLDQFFDHIISSEVFLKVDKKESKNNKIAEIKLAIPGKDLFASKQYDTFEEAVDEAVEAVRKQVIKHKEKLMAKH